MTESERETDVIFTRDAFVVAIVLDRSWHLFGGRKFSLALSFLRFYLIEVSKADIQSTQTDTFLSFFSSALFSPLRIEKLCQRIRANAFVYTHISRKRRDTHTHTHI